MAREATVTRTDIERVHGVEGTAVLLGEKPANVAPYPGTSRDDPDLRPDQRRRVGYSEDRAIIGTRPARYGW